MDSNALLVLYLDSTGTVLPVITPRHLPGLGRPVGGGRGGQLLLSGLLLLSHSGLLSDTDTVTTLNLYLPSLLIQWSPHTCLIVLINTQSVTDIQPFAFIPPLT